MRISDGGSDGCSSELVGVGIEVQGLRTAIATVVAAAEREGDGVADRAGDVAPDGDRVVIAIGDLGRAAEFILRLLRDDADDAGRRILAKQRRLRTAQHFDTLDVRKVARSEEHTSELQSLMRISYAVFCLKKTKNN